MADVADAKAEWVSRVLGIVPGGATRNWPAIKSSWLDASEQVDGQLDRLRRLLLGSSDKRLHDIAEFGLNAMTAGFKVRMLAAMRAMDQAGEATRPAAAAALIKAATALRAQLLGDARVAACDACPHEQVSIAATLGGALAGMIAALGRLRTGSAR